MKNRINFLIVLFLLSISLHHASAQGTTAFTYQGQLHDNGTNANGNYTMIFSLYDSAGGNNQIGSTITTSATLANGLFSVNLDFGNVFNGSARYLDITVTNGGIAQELSPRVQVLPAPYALYAATANVAANSTTATSAISANSLNSGIWNASVFTNNGNIYLIFSANGSAVMGLTTNSVTVIGKQLGFANNGGSITGDGNDGLVVNNNLSVVNNLMVGPTNENEGTISSDGLGDVVIGKLAGPGGTGLNLNGGMNVNGAINITNGSGSLAINVTSGNFFDNGAVTAVAYYTSSDRNLKENFTPIDSQTVLDRVVNLPISQWSFKKEANTRHIGPMAQDFYAAFNVGMDDKHIATVDEDGVALAAIQGLNQKLEADAKAKDAKINELEKRLSDLENLVKSSANK
ncbi:MAG TPA: tail fiber domain-containing protein [Verrucomicrobiae bacterium]|jgi:hypothetical protein